MSQGVDHACDLDNVWVDYCGFVELTRTGKDSTDWKLAGRNKKIHISGRSLRVDKLVHVHVY